MASSFSSFEPLLTYLSELNQWQAQKQFSRPRIIKKLETESDYQIQIYKEYGDFSSYEFCVLKPARAYKSLVQLLVELREDHFKKVFQFNSNDIDIHSIHWEYYEDENILVLNIPKKQDLCYNLMDFTLPGFFNFGGPFVGQTAIFNSPQRKQSHIFTELEDDLIRAQYQKEAEEAAQVARWKQEEPAIRAQYQKEAEEAALIGRLKQAEAADNEMARKVAEDEAKQQDELDNKELQRLEREGQIRAQKEYERAKKEAANRAKQRAEAQKRRKELREMNKARQEEEQKRREEHDKLVEQQQKFLQNLLSNMYADPLLELRKEQKEREKVPRSSSDGNTKKQQQERAAELQPEPLDGDDDEGEDVSMSEPGAEKKKEEQISSRSSSSSKATHHPTIEDVDDDEYVVFRKKFGSN